MSNIYYDPKVFGLEVFEQVNDDNADYSFDDLVIWRRLKDGRLFFATDSGCSCPSPFEDTGITDLTPITDLSQFEISFDNYNKPHDSAMPRCTVDRKQEVLRKVKAHLETLK